MTGHKYSETLQEAFCDELERHENVLARRYDPVERDRLMQAAATLHTWLSSLASKHQEAAASLTCAELANAFALTVGGLRVFKQRRVRAHCWRCGYEPSDD